MTNTANGPRYDAVPNQTTAYDPYAAASYPPAPGYPTPMETTVSSYPQTPYPQTPYAQAPAVDPGRTLGVVGLVLAFLANVVGLVVSVVAFRRSKRAGFRNGLALAGIVVGGLSTAAMIIAIAVGGVALGGVAKKCQELGPGTHVVNGVTYTCG